MMERKKHPCEATASWQAYIGQESPAENYSPSLRHNRKLKNHDLESLQQLEFRRSQVFVENKQSKDEAIRRKYEKHHKKNMKRVRKDPGTRHEKEHGIMIDAGSSGSRLHLYEFDPRILSTSQDVEDAVSGIKITFPYAKSRWTDRLRPGVDSFAGLPEKELEAALKEYLSPLLEFAKAVLHEEQQKLQQFPIFFRATAGMRVLGTNDRSLVLDTIRSLFKDKSFCPFFFEDEFVRVLSGEEEAVFGWAGINFAMGTLMEQSEGIGKVVNPKLTYGALDLGGASTQIAFYEPHEDIMANLFKLQIGQSKHWNIYAHSFLYFGMNEARKRFQARLASRANKDTRLVEGVHNPCLPGGSKEEVRLKIHFDENGHETFNFKSNETKDGYYQVLLKNGNNTSNFDECLIQTREILNLDANTWCEFAHQGRCSFNGVSMPNVPAKPELFGEFLAFSAFYHVWDELNLPRRASIQELYEGTKTICTMSSEEAFTYSGRIGADIETVEDLCFRASYAYNLLTSGYGFTSDDYITATDVVGGLKVGWSLGAMLYEINTLPWKIDDSNPHFFVAATGENSPSSGMTATIFAITMIMVGVSLLARWSGSNERKLYEPLKANTDVHRAYT